KEEMKGRFCFTCGKPTSRWAKRCRSSRCLSSCYCQECGHAMCTHGHRTTLFCPDCLRKFRSKICQQCGKVFETGFDEYCSAACFHQSNGFQLASHQTRYYWLKLTDEQRDARKVFQSALRSGSFVR